MLLLIEGLEQPWRKQCHKYEVKNTKDEMFQSEFHTSYFKLPFLLDEIYIKNFN
jgi:hypothetical protein